MKNLTISIFGSKVFPEIIKEIDLFSNAKIVFHENHEDIVLDENSKDGIIVYFLDKKNIDNCLNLKKKDLPILIVNNNSQSLQEINNNFKHQINAPFNIVNFKKKIIAILASEKFKNSSLIKLGKYTINKNERKITRNDLELKLTEKEINFLILFTHYTKPINKNFILKNLWKYSSETNTHTVETHIHRLRRKILDKFKDNNFIKNNSEGYYI